MSKRNWLGILLITPVLAGLIYMVVQTSEHTAWGGGYWEQWLVGQAGLTPENAQFVVFYFRKTVHFFFYGTLAVLFEIYFYEWGLRRFVMILGIVAGTSVAAMDEYCQSLTSFRSGKITDVLLDLCGAVIVTAVVVWVRRRKAGETS